MNVKSLMMTSVIALISASAVQAADVIVPHDAAPAVVTAPAFSWTGFYLGGQIGNFSSEVQITDSDSKDKISEDRTPKPSGFMGGLYAGSNLNLGNGFILGVETDAVFADREDTKTILTKVLDDSNLADFEEDLKDAGIKLPDGAKVVKGGTASYGFTYKEKWSGTTRVRIGFAAADRILPYVAGGIAYAQMQGISTVTGTIAVIAPAVAAPYDDPDVANNKLKTVSGTLLDKTTMMIGYTLGGGIDYAMTDNVLVRAEYRYSDFGKKKFQDDGAEFNYKTNDFRVGVAYKF